MDLSCQTALGTVGSCSGGVDPQSDWEIWEQEILEQERSITYVRYGSCIQNMHLGEGESST